MDTIQRLERHWTFYPLYTMLRKQEEPDRTSKGRIDDARKFFESVAKSLESMITPNGTLFMIDDLRTAVEALGGKMEVTRTEMREYIQQIRGYMWQLKELKDHPKEFYGKQKYDCLVESCRRLTDFYTSENNQPLVCEDSSFETDD